MSSEQEVKKRGGRTKGTPNKKTRILQELAEDLKVDPFEILLRLASGDWAGLGYDSATTLKYSNGVGYEVDRISVETRLSAASEACQYLYPKRKAIDVTSGGMSAAQTFAEIMRQAAAGNGGG
jgi:hypothetical protein